VTEAVCQHTNDPSDVLICTNTNFRCATETLRYRNSTGWPLARSRRLGENPVSRTGQTPVFLACNSVSAFAYKKQGRGAPRPCFVGRVFRLFDHKIISLVPYFPTTA